MEMRLESDSIGECEVPVDAYYGVQTLRAKRNFPITQRSLRREMILSLGEIKMACALTNMDAGVLDNEKASLIVEACKEVMDGVYDEAFIVDPIQGGAGTSTNMNANEVIANIANKLHGDDLGSYAYIHPNDDVNKGQSTNDVYPTAGKLTALKLVKPLIEELSFMIDALDHKSIEFEDVFKMGRTQLQDAVPMRLGQSFHAYEEVLKRDLRRIKEASHEIEIINMGGTAIGTAINADPMYLANITRMLCYVTHEDLKSADDLIDGTQNTDGYVVLSSALKTCAINLSKMCNDLRLLSSGPKTGLGEINLPPMQNGSSIMPGKVNPVIPEVMNQIAFHVAGNDVTIAMASEAGQMELNAFEPVLFDSLFSSLTTMTNGIRTLREHCILGISANKERCADLLEHSVGSVTAICPYVGYKSAATLAKEALKTNTPIRTVLKEHHLFDETQINEILDVHKLTDPIHLVCKY